MNSLRLPINVSGVPLTVPLTISDALTRHAVEVERTGEGPRVLLEGAVTRISRVHDGRAYVRITDGVEEIEAVAFGRRTVRMLPDDLERGMTVHLEGTLIWYEQDGRVQLKLERIRVPAEEAQPVSRLEGLGATAALPLRSRPLPALPRTVGLVTGTDSEALRDVTAVFQERAPWVRLLHAPALLEGAEAPRSIADAIERASREAEVVIVARGGGSRFVAFDDERVVHAIARCPVPVVTGIGHASDRTRADDAADHACATPQAAATVVTDGHALLPQKLERALVGLERCVQARLLEVREHLAEVEHALARLCEQATVAPELVPR